MKPYFQDNAVTIYHGDCREIVPSLGKFDLLLTDPPYNEVNDRPNFGGWSIRSVNKGVADSTPVDLKQLGEMLIPVISGSIYIWCGFEQFSNWISIFRERGLLARCGRWEKTNPSPLNAQHTWLSDVELCAFAHQKNAPFNQFYSRARWELPSCRTTEHPTEKPIDLFLAIIGSSSMEGQTILDPFAGSGTTARAAKDLGRKCTLIEREEKYCEIAAKRMEQEVFAL